MTEQRRRYVGFTAEGSISAYRVWEGKRELGEVHRRIATGAWAAWTPDGAKVMGSPFGSRRVAVEALEQARLGKRAVRHA